MKSRTVMICGVIALAVFALLAVGCQQPFPLKAATEHDRIKLFQDAINGGDYNDIMTCFSTDVTIYNTMNTSNFWSGSQYSHDWAPFTVTRNNSPTPAPDYSGSQREEETIDGQAGGPSNHAVTFWLINPTGDNWVIRELYFGSSTAIEAGVTANGDDIF